MAEVLMFHHVLGLTPGVESFAERIRSVGHAVHTPDLFGGRRFSSTEEGAGYVEEVGFDSLVDLGVAAADYLPAEVVYAGFSLGVLPAQKLAQTRPGSTGALLFEACVPADHFGDRWPDGLAVQIHGKEADPFFAGEGDLDAARALVADASGSGRAELFVYPGDEHLFLDDSLPSFDADATEVVVGRVLELLAAATK